MAENRFTDEELAICKDTDLVQLCNTLGYTTMRVGNFYTIEGMDSVRIKDRHTYMRYSQDKGGSQIDFLMNLEGMSFTEAVEYLLDYNGKSRGKEEMKGYAHKEHLHYNWYRIEKKGDKYVAVSRTAHISDSAQQPVETEKKEFALPNQNYNFKRLYWYLCDVRKIPQSLVQFFIDQRSIYEDYAHHNILFVGRDLSGNARHASVRGTYNPAGKAAFKGVLPGADPHYPFSYTNLNNDTLIVCEAPIDCMSACAILDWDNKKGDMSFGFNYLALTGTHRTGLYRYLEEHPHIKEIMLGLDRDEAGNKAIEEIKQEFSTGEWRNKGIKVTVYQAFVDGCKDWNQALIEINRGDLELTCKREIEADGKLSPETEEKLDKENYRFDMETGTVTVKDPDWFCVYPGDRKSGAVKINAVIKV